VGWTNSVSLWRLSVMWWLSGDLMAQQGGGGSFGCGGSVRCGASLG
jgi:hypothetical protein